MYPVHPGPPLYLISVPVPPPYPFAAPVHPAAPPQACPSYVYNPISNVCARCFQHPTLHPRPSYHPPVQTFPHPTTLAPILQPPIDLPQRNEPPSNEDSRPTPLLPPPNIRAQSPPDPSNVTITMSQSAYTNILTRLSRLESYFQQENIREKMFLHNAQLLAFEYHHMKELGEQLEEEVAECSTRIEEGEARLDKLERGAIKMEIDDSNEETMRKSKRRWENDELDYNRNKRVRNQ